MSNRSILFLLPKISEIQKLLDGAAIRLDGDLAIFQIPMDIAIACARMAAVRTYQGMGEPSPTRWGTMVHAHRRVSQTKSLGDVQNSLYKGKPIWIGESLDEKLFEGESKC